MSNNARAAAPRSEALLTLFSAHSYGLLLCVYYYTITTYLSNSIPTLYTTSLVFPLTDLLPFENVKKGRECAPHRILFSIFSRIKNILSSALQVQYFMAVWYDKVFSFYFTTPPMGEFVHIQNAHNHFAACGRNDWNTKNSPLFHFILHTFGIGMWHRVVVPLGFSHNAKEPFLCP